MMRDDRPPCGDERANVDIILIECHCQCVVVYGTAIGMKVLRIKCSTTKVFAICGVGEEIVRLN